MSKGNKPILTVRKGNFSMSEFAKDGLGPTVNLQKFRKMKDTGEYKYESIRIFDNQLDDIYTVVNNFIIERNNAKSTKE